MTPLMTKSDWASFVIVVGLAVFWIAALVVVIHFVVKFW